MNNGKEIHRLSKRIISMLVDECSEVQIGVLTMVVASWLRSYESKDGDFNETLKIRAELLGIVCTLVAECMEKEEGWE